jgi:hypothetical protein
MFGSFLLGGFECSAMVKPCGTRLDLIETTKHAVNADADYRALAALGIRAARDGVRWHLIDRGDAYDWSSMLAQLRAAEAAGVKVIWDLNHYDCPEGLDIWSETFVERFAAYAKAAAQFIAANSAPPHYFCPINEMSYWSWAGGHAGLFHPCATDRGHDLKRQLVLAFIAAAKAIRASTPSAVIITAEPLIEVRSTPESCGAAFHESQFEAVDMILGLRQPELGGSAELVDAVGVNFYPHNQWYSGGPTIPFGHQHFRPLSHMLLDAQARHAKPLLITETAAEGSAKAAWLSYIVQEVFAARRAEAIIEGVCLYPIISFPHWFSNDLNDSGIWSSEVGLQGRRRVDGQFHAAIVEQSARIRSLIWQTQKRAPSAFLRQRH